MLERFETITKVGLFDLYTHSSSCEIGQVTIIYGENGVGKSTLAAILDSLRERNPTEIIRRRSLPGDISPSVSVTMNGKLFTFDGNDWDGQLPHDTLEVFFPGFVTRNVHAATGVETENRRNLCEFVLGRKAVEKVKRLAQADEEGRAALNQIKDIEKQLKLQIQNPDTLETFLSLSHDEKIDGHIERVRAELKQAQSREAILARVLPAAVLVPPVDREQIAGLLARRAEGISEGVAAVVREHVRQHLDSEGEMWLAYGARHGENVRECPFCGQDLAGSSLIESIRAYFSAHYLEYTKSLSEDVHEIRERLGTAAFQQLMAAISTQVAIAAQWTEEMPIDPTAIATSLGEAEKLWKVAAARMGNVLTEKQATPLKSLAPGLLEEAVQGYEQALSLLQKVNALLLASKNKAEDRRAALSKADTAEIEPRLRRLENQKLRFEPWAQEMLVKRNALLDARTKLDAEKAVLKKEIDQHANRVVGKYQAGINHYLEQFGCDIRIGSVEPKFPSGRASVQYKLTAHGHEIELGYSSAGPCFETVLSEGDKYTLALSFFLARLKDQSDLSSRVVVLDDPVNSLGSSRRIFIASVIRDLRLRGAQVVVLTHDERLAAMMWRDKKLKGIVPLQVQRTRTGSQLLQWDVEEATQSEYVRHYLTLADYLDNGGDHRPAASCIRPYLEQRLRHLFPGPPFETRDTLGLMIGKIRESKPESRLQTLKARLPDLEALNEASLPSAHASDDVPGMAALTPEHVRLFAQKALDALL
ncbi:MAG: AAA family ATPase [Candidatus Methylomirabilia bacterium]